MLINIKIGGGKMQSINEICVCFILCFIFFCIFSAYERYGGKMKDWDFLKFGSMHPIYCRKSKKIRCF